MESFSLQDLFTILAVVIAIGVVSALGPAIWRALPRLWDYFIDRPLGDIASIFTSSDAPVLSDDRTGFDGGSDWFAGPVLGQQNQAEPNEPGENEPAIQFSTLQNLSDTDLIGVLAVQRLPNGAWRFSANKIRDIVGGSDAAVKAEVVKHRPKDEQPKPARGKRLERPANGWGG